MADSPKFANCPEGCPPQPHQELRGIYYRLVSVESNPPDYDFKSHAERGLKPRVPSPKSLCDYCAISLFDTQKNAENYLSQNPEFRFRFLAKMNLTNGGHGVVHLAEHSHRGHHNWWLHEGDSARNYFTGKIQRPTS